MEVTEVRIFPVDERPSRGLDTVWHPLKRIEWKPQHSFRSPASYPYMRILRRFTFPVLCIFYLVACNSATTISIEALGNTPADITSRFFFPTSGSSAEAYLIRPTGPGPFPLMILLHGYTFGSIGGAQSIVPEAEAFVMIFAMPV